MADKITETEKLVRAALELHRAAKVARETDSASSQHPARTALDEVLKRADSLASRCTSEVWEAANELQSAQERLARFTEQREADRASTT